MLARAAYGAKPGEAAALARQGLGPWLDRQLALPPDDPTLVAQLEALRVPIRYAKGPDEPAVDEARPLLTLAASQTTTGCWLAAAASRRSRAPSATARGSS
ncbi:hypothetical protein ACFQU2_17030 [Siccirubricoccus deserti]